MKFAYADPPYYKQGKKLYGKLHDELVDIAIVKDLNRLIRKQMKAIDTVFELHKPTGWFEDTGYADQECIHCDNGSYPCPTIQAIEKELK